MSMKLVQLPLYLNPDEALSLIDFLAQLQDLLWNHYGDAIQRSLRDPDNADPSAPDADEPQPF